MTVADYNDPLRHTELPSPPSLCHLYLWSERRQPPHDRCLPVEKSGGVLKLISHFPHLTDLFFNPPLRLLPDERSKGIMPFVPVQLDKAQGMSWHLPYSKALSRPTSWPKHARRRKSSLAFHAFDRHRHKSRRTPEKLRG